MILTIYEIYDLLFYLTLIDRKTTSLFQLPHLLNKRKMLFLPLEENTNVVIFQCSMPKLLTPNLRKARFIKQQFEKYI